MAKIEGGGVLDDMWQCLNCHSLNRSFALYCYSCRTPRQSGPTPRVEALRVQPAVTPPSSSPVASPVLPSPTPPPSMPAPSGWQGGPAPFNPGWPPPPSMPKVRASQVLRLLLCAAAAVVFVGAGQGMSQIQTYAGNTIEELFYHQVGFFCYAMAILSLGLAFT